VELNCFSQRCPRTEPLLRVLTLTSTRVRPTSTKDFSGNLSRGVELLEEHTVPFASCCLPFTLVSSPKYFDFKYIFEEKKRIWYRAATTNR